MKSIISKKGHYSVVFIINSKMIYRRETPPWSFCFPIQQKTEEDCAQCAQLAVSSVGIICMMSVYCIKFWNPRHIYFWKL